MSNTISVALFAFNSMAACMDVLPLLLLSPSFGGSIGLGVNSLFLGVGLLTGVAEMIITSDTYKYYLGMTE